MRVIRSAIFNVFFFTYCFIIPLWLWVLMLGSRDLFRRGVRTWPLGTLPVLEHLLGITYEVRGLEHLPAGPHIRAAKHQSTWDTMFFLLDDPDIAYALKKELTRLPFWGWYTRYARHIVIDRKAGATALKSMIRQTRDILEEGRSVVIFPEGTRVSPGETGTYFPGIAALYTQVGVPVVPVAVNSGVFWGRRSFRKQPGTIVLEYFPPIEPGMDRKAFMKQLQTTIEDGTRKLEAEAMAAIEQAERQKAIPS